MSAFGHCITCGVTCIDAISWADHERRFHAPHDEMVCLFCGRPFPRALFAVHPCVGKVFAPEVRP